MAKLHQWCAWSGVIFMALFLVGWAGLAYPLFPPPSPELSPAQVVELFQRQPGMLRLGLVLLILAAGFFALYSAEVAYRLFTLPLAGAPLLGLGQLLGGAVNTLFFILSPVLWGVAAYRPERDPDITQAINDIGWFFFFQPVSLILVQFVTIALAAFLDTRSQPLFPRWVGYLNLWMMVIFLPSLLLTFFKSGPFAWNGLLCFWVPVAAFAPWVGVTIFYLLRAARADISN